MKNRLTIDEKNFLQSLLRFGYSASFAEGVIKDGFWLEFVSPRKDYNQVEYSIELASDKIFKDLKDKIYYSLDDLGVSKGW